MDLILKHRGNYKALLTFKKATVIYDLTYHFCTKYLSKGDRTVDQMIQAARSGKKGKTELESAGTAVQGQWRPPRQIAGCRRRYQAKPV